MNFTMESVFPDYTIEKTLKTGTRGNVFVVRHRETKMRCIYREFEGNGEAYRKLQDVNSPYLPQVYRVTEQDGRVFVLEEYVTGDTLAFLLEGDPLTLVYTRQIAMQLCDALEILHGFGMVHRDVKPENIIVRGNQAVLIDFDASRVIKPNNSTDTQVMGTTGYAAPEQYGFSQTDARADVYSMGVLMNEMLTRQHPSRQLTDTPLRPIIERCIEVNVDKRYFTAAELRNAIRECCDTKKRKKKAVIGGLIAASAVVLSLCAILLLNGSSGKEEPISETTAAATEPIQTTQTAPAMEVFEPQPLEVSPEPWAGHSALYMTHFQYDLDGDGEMEDYEFGIYQEDLPEGFRQAYDDNFRLVEGQTCRRTAYPAVWKYVGDGAMELVEEFAPLLTDAGVRLWRASGNNAPAPMVYTVDGFLPGGIQAYFTLEQEGIWFYEITATLGAQQLTAMARSNVIRME